MATDRSESQPTYAPPGCVAPINTDLLHFDIFEADLQGQPHAPSAVTPQPNLTKE